MPRPDKTKLYICWQTMACHLSTGDVVFHKGTRLRGDHEAVRTYPGNFVVEGTPDDEWPNPFAAVG